jgi:hypothetical protein
MGTFSPFRCAANRSVEIDTSGHRARPSEIAAARIGDFRERSQAASTRSQYASNVFFHAGRSVQRAR